ncbi:hypothetical protein T265_09489 [Opisthorchis viverrini]|uniref:Uncharacterized protein n=1 Tax=Opisthorchis viverrini TaxID=6198 RepID=A0A074ZGN8_OPIVI|nr:hypothetical protein T265_09489 [Opisthorchis viverrini]KER22410.1 hypothetical protein T265_09489 [Opisthorchis viverrini]
MMFSGPFSPCIKKAFAEPPPNDIWTHFSLFRGRCQSTDHCSAASTSVWRALALELQDFNSSAKGRHGLTRVCVAAGRGTLSRVPGDRRLRGELILTYALFEQSLANRLWCKHQDVRRRLTPVLESAHALSIKRCGPLQYTCPLYMKICPFQAVRTILHAFFSLIPTPPTVAFGLQPIGKSCALTIVPKPPPTDFDGLRK